MCMHMFTLFTQRMICDIVSFEGIKLVSDFYIIIFECLIIVFGYSGLIQCRQSSRDKNLNHCFNSYKMMVRIVKMLEKIEVK